MNAMQAILAQLAPVADALAAQFGTDTFFVLRAAATQNGRGSTVKTYQPTTAAALPCFCAVLPAQAEALEEQRANQRRPVVFRRFVVGRTVNVQHDDRLRLVARGSVPQIDMEIVRVAPLSGLYQEVITVAEAPAA